MVAVEHVITVDAGDLVATAGAGVTLDALERELSRHGAWLALDPSGPVTMTLGQCLASGAGGPLSAGFGLPRDQVLGLSFTAPSGALAKTGGRVVKNVAGFDLAKLLIGSHGRFGTITEAHLRLRIRPATDLTAIAQAGRADLPAMTSRVIAAGVNPVCFEVFDANLAGALGLHSQWTLALRAVGSAVAAREELDACPAELRTGESALWAEWRRITGAWPALIRTGADPATWHDAVDLITAHLGAPLGISVTVPRGTVRAGLDRAPASAVQSLRLAAAERGWPVVVERSPDGLDPWGDLPEGVARLTRRLAASWSAAGIA
jgi:glycolate oxidase FAD binding subunit